MLLEHGVAATLVGSQYFGQVAGHAGHALGVHGSVAAGQGYGHAFARRDRRVVDPEDARPVAVSVGAAAVKLGVHLVDDLAQRRVAAVPVHGHRQHVLRTQVAACNDMFDPLEISVVATLRRPRFSGLSRACSTL